MLETLPFCLEDETSPLPPGEWFDDLIWTPSQCYYRLQHHGVDYILYLYWRGRDPWQAYVVKDAASLSSMNNGQAIWSADIFELHQAYFTDLELEQAKDQIIRLFYEFNGNFLPLRLILQYM
jgi:hypothetical protein